MTLERAIDVESMALHLEHNGPRSLESLIEELGPAVRITRVVGELIHRGWARVVAQDDGTLMIEPRRRRSRMLAEEVGRTKKLA